MFTMFMDMHSGGKLKIPPYQYFVIEADEEDANGIFQSEFDRNPWQTTCSCCGNDYSAHTDDTLAQLSGYHRGCDCRYFCDDGRVLTESELRKMTKADFHVKEKNPGHWEYVEEPTKPNGKVQTVEEFLARKDVCVVSPTKPWTRKERDYEDYEDED